MWNSLRALEKLENYRSSKKKAKVDNVTENIKIGVTRASSESELFQVLEKYKEYKIEVEEVLRECIKNGKTTVNMKELYASILENMGFVKEMRYILGRGSYGIAYRVSVSKVVKETNISLIKPQIYAQEVEVLKKLLSSGKHLNIMDIFYLHENRTVYEFLYCTTLNSTNQLCLELFDLIEKTHFDHKKRLYIVYNNNLINQMYDGLNFLHSRNIFHRDVKPENIMVTGTIPNAVNLKIIDFNLSCVLEENKSLASNFIPPGRLGSPEYVSLQHYDFPQYIGKEMQNDIFNTVTSIMKLSDMWSFIITTWLIIYGGQPYNKPSYELDTRFKMYIKNGNFKLDSRYEKLITSILEGYDPNSNLASILNLLWKISDKGPHLTEENKDEFYTELTKFLGKSNNLKFSDS